ncbi:unnamed protein product [Ixodes persulcatus]
MCTWCLATLVRRALELAGSGHDPVESERGSAAHARSCRGAAQRHRPHPHGPSPAADWNTGARQLGD